MSTDTVTGNALVTQEEFAASNLAQFAEASTGQIETHLGVLYDLAEHSNDELLKSQVQNVWQHTLKLKTTTDNAIDTAVAARELAKAAQTQRNQVIDELSALSTAMEDFDSDNSKVEQLMETVSDECWQQWLDDDEREIYDQVQVLLTSMMILSGQVKNGKYIDVTRLIIDAFTGNFILDDQSEDLLRQFIASLIEHEAQA